MHGTDMIEIDFIIRCSIKVSILMLNFLTVFMNFPLLILIALYKQGHNVFDALLIMFQGTPMESASG